MLCCAVLCCAVLCCAVLCCAVLCCAVLCWVLPGDIESSFAELALQIRSAQSVAMSGVVLWTTDIGGYAYVVATLAVD